MTHSPHFGAENRHRLLECYTDLVPDFSGVSWWCVLFHADFWYTRDHYGDRWL